MHFSKNTFTHTPDLYLAVSFNTTSPPSYFILPLRPLLQSSALHTPIFHIPSENFTLYTKIEKVANRENKENRKIHISFEGRTADSDSSTETESSMFTFTPASFALLRPSADIVRFNPAAYFELPGTEKMRGKAVEGLDGKNMTDADERSSPLIFDRTEKLEFENVPKMYCSDPYRTGGYVDEDRTNQSSFPKNNGKQFLWQSLQSSPIGTFIPSDPYSTAGICTPHAIDTKTKTAIETYTAKKKSNLKSVPSNLSNALSLSVKTSSTPTSSNKKQSASKTSSSKSTPYAIVSSDFRTFGNVFSSYSGFNPKAAGLYNRAYERALEKTVVFESTVTVTADSTTGKKPTALVPSYAFSFVFLDPVSDRIFSYYWADSIFFDLDRFRPEQNLFAGSTYTFDIAERMSEIATDTAGYAKDKSKHKPYGLSGVLNIRPYLARTIEPDVIQFSNWIPIFRFCQYTKLNMWPAVEVG